MKTKRIKNNTASTKTYIGQDILAGAYYSIQPSEDSIWLEDKALVLDITSGDALVNNGSSDFTDWMEGLNYLKDTGMQDTRSVITQDNQTRRPFGFYFTGTKETTTTHYKKLPYDCNLRGGVICANDAEPGDNFDIEVEDKDGTVYPAGTIVKTYINDYVIFNGIVQEELDESISSTIPKEFYIKVTYRSQTGATVNPKIGINFVGYESA